MPTPKELLYTTTFAVKKELKDPLRAAVASIGVASVSDLLAMVALHGDAVAEALRPVVEGYMEDKMVISRGRGKATVSRGRGKATVLREQFAEMNVAELEALQAEIAARRVGA